MTEADDLRRRNHLREAFRGLIGLLDDCREEDGMEPMRTAVLSARGELVEAFGDDVGIGDVVGECLGCCTGIVKGDLGNTTTDSEYFCANCAPTWADIREDWLEHDDHEDEDRAAGLAAYDAHIARGGSPTDKPLHEL